MTNDLIVPITEVLREKMEGSGNLRGMARMGTSFVRH